MLVDGDFKLWKSNAILQYITSQNPTTHYPSNAKGGATFAVGNAGSSRIRSRHTCQPLTFESLVKKFVNLGAAKPAVVAEATEAFTKEAKMLDAHLARHKYLVNDTLTIADFTVAAPLFHAQGAGMPVASYANIGAWFGARLALPCWSETAPQMAAAA